MGTRLGLVYGLVRSALVGLFVLGRAKCRIEHCFGLVGEEGDRLFSQIITLPKSKLQNSDAKIQQFNDGIKKICTFSKINFSLKLFSYISWVQKGHLVSSSLHIKKQDKFSEICNLRRNVLIDFLSSV